MRYIVSGVKDGVSVGSRFKTLGWAKKFADSLSDSEVYDTKLKTYVYGTSKFVIEFLKGGK